MFAFAFSCFLIIGLVVDRFLVLLAQRVLVALVSSWYVLLLVVAS